MIQGAMHTRLLRRVNVFAFVTLVFLSYCAYSNTFYAPPVLDDFHSFIEDPLLRVSDWSLQTLMSLGETKFGWSRYLPVTTLAFDIWLGGGELFNLHLTNFLIHLFCFVSVVFLGVNILRAAAEGQKHEPSSALSPMTLALIVAGLWVLHPLQTNAVTYLIQRMASLVSLFTFLSVGFYILGRRMLASGRVAGWKAALPLTACLTATAMAFLSKQNSAIIPFLILGTEVWFFNPDLPSQALRFFRKHKLVAGILTVSACVVLTHLFMVKVLPSYSNRHFTLLERLLTESRVLVWYVSMLLWPSPGRLSLEHDVVVSTSLLSPPTTLLSLLVLASAFGWMLGRRRRYPVVTYGIFWFFTNMVIESSVLSLELVFEHRMYLPSVGLLISLVVGITQGVEKSFTLIQRREMVVGAWCMTAIFASLLTLATYERNNAWQDGVTFGRDNVAKAPHNPRSHANLAVALWRRGEYAEAIESARRSIALGRRNFEEYAVSVNTIVMSRIGLREYETAIEEGTRLLGEKPQGIKVDSLPIVQLNLSVAHISLEQYKSALESVEEALAFIRRHPAAFGDSTLRNVALRHLQRIVTESGRAGVDLDSDGVADPGELDPSTWIARRLLQLEDVTTARMVLAQIAPTAGGDTEADRMLAKLDEEDRRNRLQMERKDFASKYVRHPWSRFHASMALSFLIQKHKLNDRLNGLGEGLVDYAVRLRPDSADAHLLKAWYAFNRGDVERAVDSGRYALALDGDYARGWLGLGYFLAKANRPDESVAAFKRTLQLHPGIEQKHLILQMIASLENNGVPLDAHENDPSDKMAGSAGPQVDTSANPS